MEPFEQAGKTNFLGSLSPSAATLEKETRAFEQSFGKTVEVGCSLSHLDGELVDPTLTRPIALRALLDVAKGYDESAELMRAMRAMAKCTPDERDDLKRLFLEMDADGSGTLDVDEIFKLLSRVSPDASLEKAQRLVTAGAGADRQAGASPTHHHHHHY